VVETPGRYGCVCATLPPDEHIDGGCTMTTIADDEPLAVAVTGAIQAGDVATLATLLDEHPGLATTRITRSDCDDEQGPTPVARCSTWRPTGPGTSPTGPRW
jgi:uncharacterized protein